MSVSNTNAIYATHIPHAVTIIGCGGIGSIIAPMIAKCGVKRLTLHDHDTFKPVNLQVQNVHHADLGKNKAEAVGRDALSYNPEMAVRVRPRKFTHRNRLDGIVIAAVDSIEVRRMIWERVRKDRERIPLYIDGRLSRSQHELFQVLAVDPNCEQQAQAYEPWLFPGKTLPKEPRPTQLAAHTPYGLAWVIGCVLARFISGENRPWEALGDGVSVCVNANFVSGLNPKEG